MLNLFFCENSWKLTHECHEMTGRIIKPVGNVEKPLLYISEVMFFIKTAMVDNFYMNRSEAWRAYRFEIWRRVGSTWSTL